ncbi:MAG: peptidase M23, partial [Acidimicrobiales bacterium]
YRPATGLWYLRDTASAGSATTVFEFGGEPGDVPVVGDWNGDGRDGIGLYRPSVGTWYLRETATGGSSNRIVEYGPKWVIG